ncbi:MAG: thioesterase family protein [Gammaproteobacteria bacterium]|nr:thioesterase family protein [Gammaproteobacteria bacterium]MCF6259562.1 thioesterase family protein [Gammaproteobacteria bacterium]
MNLVLRMIALLVGSFFKSDLPVERPKNALSLRVLPNDIDINLHMNNGRYLTICDLTRVDMFIRTGLAKTMIVEKWMPVISEHTMKYKKALTLFQKYEIKMEITGWDERSFQMVHTFIVGDRVVAEGTSLGVIVSKSGVVPPVDVMERVVERLDRKNT